MTAQMEEANLSSIANLPVTMIDHFGNLGMALRFFCSHHFGNRSGMVSNWISELRWLAVMGSLLVGVPQLKQSRF